MSASGTIDDLLIRWQELRRHGTTPSVSELCAEHPSLAEELARRIAAFESMEQMLGMGSTASFPAPVPHGAVPKHLAEKLLPLGYELLEVIDQGGMGVVYKARQIGLRRTVALKMIAGLRIGPKQLARFRVEAEAVAQLQHPHIVQIHEVGEVDGHSFFAMEYVEGGTLAHRLVDGPLPCTAAAELLEILARAIHHAHTRGVIHRDIKPANILLAADYGSEATNSDGTPLSTAELTPAPLSTLKPKVTDFGLAKRLGAEGDQTATGEVVGTPAYMAPEQASGNTGSIGTPCDIWALGAILYECLAGRPPFRSESVLETLRQVIADDPTPLRRVRADVPRDLEAICLKCLEKQPADRYASAEALADDLRRFLTGAPVKARRRSVPARVLRWVRRHPLRAAVIFLAALTAAAVPASDYIESVQRRAREAAEKDRREKRAVEVAAQAREILRRNCYECHGGKSVERDFRVLDRTSLLDPTRKYVVPDDLGLSRLIQRIEDGSMPPEPDELYLPRVSEEELSILKEWITYGAPEFPPEDPNNPTPPVVPYSALAAEVKEIFVQRCYDDCHMASKADGGIKIMNHRLLVTTRKGVVVPGHPEASELYQLITAPDFKLMMPVPNSLIKYKPKLKTMSPEELAKIHVSPEEVAQTRLRPEEIATIRKWIEAGAPPFPRTQPKE